MQVIGEAEKTPHALAHERAVREYGSWDNAKAKEQLDKDDSPLRNEYYKLGNTYGYEEAIVEHMTAGVPYPMDSVTLATMDICLIGAPDGSALYKRIAKGDDFRAKRKPESVGQLPIEPFWFDYTENGWPSDQGCPRRYVTPEEHREILRRLNTGALTRPGSPVALKSQTLASLMAEDVPRPVWIIDDLLREGGAMMLHGPSGIGKTLFVHTLMLMAAHGRSIGVRDEETGTWVLKAGDHEGFKVGLLDGEMTKADIYERTALLCGALGLKPGGNADSVPPMDPQRLRLSFDRKGAKATPDDIELWVAHAAAQREAYEQAEATNGVASGDTLDLSNIDLHIKQDQHPKAVFPDVRDPEWKQQIIAYTKAMGIKVLILDNLSTLCPSLEDENAAAQWAPLNDLVVALKAAGVATILVHHSGKGKEGGYRGSSALTTTLETRVELKAVGTERIGDARFQVDVPKRRTQGIPSVQDKTLRLTEGRWAVEVDEFNEVDRVVQAAMSGKYATQGEIGTALGMKQFKVSRTLAVAYELKKATPDAVADRMRVAKTLRDGTSKFLMDDDEAPDLDI